MSSHERNTSWPLQKEIHQLPLLLLLQVDSAFAKDVRRAQTSPNFALNISAGLSLGSSQNAVDAPRILRKSCNSSILDHPSARLKATQSQPLIIHRLSTTLRPQRRHRCH